MRQKFKLTVAWSLNYLDKEGKLQLTKRTMKIAEVGLFVPDRQPTMQIGSIYPEMS